MISAAPILIAAYVRIVSQATAVWEGATGIASGAAASQQQEGQEPEERSFHEIPFPSAGKSSLILGSIVFVAQINQ